MPIFEYDCKQCGRRYSALVGVIANPKPAACPRCGSQDAERRVSRFARLRSEDETMESLCDEASYGDLENDPKAIKKWVRDMSAAMDEDMGGDLEQAFEEEMEKGDDAGPDGGGGGSEPEL